MDAICFYLPSPLDRPPVTGVNPRKEGKEEKRKPEAKDAFCGLVFKVIAQDSGDLFFIRIYSGTVKSNSRLYNPGRDCKEVLGKLYHIHADPSQRDELPEASAGDIVATIGLKDSVTGDTLCETQHPILLERITFADSVFAQRIEPDSAGDKDKLQTVLNKLQREDPTFICKPDKETGQLIMSGMGKLHLEVKVHRIERDFRVKVRVGNPQVSYRETLRQNVQITGICDRTIGGVQVFAKVVVDFKRITEDVREITSEMTVKVNSRVKPGDIDSVFVQAAERGLKSALQSGELGYPVLNVQATIVDTGFDPEKSTEVAFEVAADDAVRKAFRENILLLEPVGKLNVGVPDEFLGTVFSYVITRRGEVDKQESDGRYASIEARVPMVKMFDYADELRSLTQGRAAPSLEPYAFAPAPEEVLRGFLNPEY